MQGFVLQHRQALSTSSAAEGLPHFRRSIVSLFRRIKWWLQDNDIALVVIWLIYAAFIVFAGYAVGGAIKEWAKTHIIIVKEIK